MKIKIILILVIIFILLNFKRKKEYFNNIYSYSDYLKSKIQTPFPIDIVYTWAGNNNSSNIRIRNNNELKYSLKSLFKYAPWFNRIFILMNPPKTIPDWFNDNYSRVITIIDQNETFPSNSKLPNKNSNAIETTLHNIDGLSEHFLYLNDDLFFGKKTDYTDFFTPDGKAIVSDTIFQKKNMLFNRKDILKLKYPETAYEFYPHIPYPFIKSEFKKYIIEYKDFIDWIRSFDYRINEGCNVCFENNLHCPCQQFHHPFGIFMYKNNKAITKKPLSIKSECSLDGYINSYCFHLLENYIDNAPNVFCINDDGNNFQILNENRIKLKNFFEKKYNFKLFYEK